MDQPQNAATSRTSLSATGRAALAATVVLSAALAWSFRSSFAYVMRFWQDPNYSYGWIIGPIVLAILWQRRDGLARLQPHPTLSGFLALGGLLVLRSYLYEQNEQWMEAAIIPLVVAAAVLAVGGWRVLRWSLPANLYLFFIIPLPPRVNDLLAGPLQTLATIGSVQVLRVLRLPALNEGNVIYVGNQHVEVAEACRGLSMLLAFAALITAMVILVRRPIWERVVLMLSVIPIALFCNIIRISVTAFAYWMTSSEVHWVHDWAGFAMMILALGLVQVELRVMSWVVVEDRAGPSDPRAIRAAFAASTGPR